MKMESFRNFRHLGFLLAVVVLTGVFMAHASCGSEDAPSSSPTPIPGFVVTETVITSKAIVTQKPPGEKAENLTEIVPGTPVSVSPDTHVVTDGGGNANLVMNIDSDTGDAITRCFLSSNTIVKTLPNGPHDKLLLSLVSGTIHCDHDNPERFNQLMISLPGSGNLIFQGTAFKVVLDPGQKARMAVANGAVSFEFFEGVAKGGQPSVMREGDALAINLGSATEQASWEIEATQFTPEDEGIFDDLSRTAAERYADGVLAYELGRFQEAIAEYDIAIILDDELVQAYNNRGLAYADLGQQEQALQDYDEAIRLNPQYALAYNNRGGAYFKLDQYERAIADYTKAIDLNPNDDLMALAYAGRGFTYGKLAQYKRAIQDYDEAIRLNPQLAVAYNNRGTTYADMDQPQRSIEDYDQAIQLNPAYAEAYNNRGTAYRTLGRQRRAIQDYDEAILLNPKHALAYCNRSLVYTSLGRDVEASQDAASALEQMTDCATIPR